MTHQAGLVFLQLAVVVAVSQLVGWLVHRLHQPLVLAQMLTGVLLGPSVLGLLLPDLAGRLFPASSLGTIQVLGNVGLVIYMFSVGVGLPRDLLRRLAPSAAGVAAASVVVPLLAGAAIGWWLIGDRQLFPADKPAWICILFFTTALAVTALPVMARIIDESRLKGTDLASLALTAGALTYAAAWLLLAVVIGAVTNRFSGFVIAVAGSLIFTIGLLRFGPTLIDRLFMRLEQVGVGSLPPVILVLVAAAAFATDAIGVHPALGAFVLGLAMPRSRQVIQVESMTTPLAVNLLLPLFFVYAGLETKIGLLGGARLVGIAILIIVVACISKGAASFGAALVSGYRWRESVSIGALMNARGLVELIILTAGLQAGVITPILFSILVLMALVTTLLASPVIRLVFIPRDSDIRLAAAAPAGRGVP